MARTSSSTTTAAAQRASAASSARTRISAASEQHACFVEIEPRRAWEQGGRIAVAEIAQEIRPPATIGKEQLVYPGVVEAGHRPSVQPHRTSSQDQIGALQRAVAECCDGGQ